MPLITQKWVFAIWVYAGIICCLSSLHRSNDQQISRSSRQCEICPDRIPLPGLESQQSARGSRWETCPHRPQDHRNERSHHHPSHRRRKMKQLEATTYILSIFHSKSSPAHRSSAESLQSAVLWFRSPEQFDQVEKASVIGNLDLGPCQLHAWEAQCALPRKASESEPTSQLPISYVAITTANSLRTVRRI